MGSEFIILWLASDRSGGSIPLAGLGYIYDGHRPHKKLPGVF
jgi:hypothetical protein